MSKLLKSRVIGYIYGNPSATVMEEVWIDENGNHRTMYGQYSSRTSVFVIGDDYFYRQGNETVSHFDFCPPLSVKVVGNWVTAEEE